jgi:hypothetical protein
MVSHQQMPNPNRPQLHIEGRINNRQILLGALFFIVMMPLYYWIKGGMTPLLWMVALIMPILVVKTIQMMVSNRPQLLLNEDGINFHHWNGVPVRWLDIKRAYFMEVCNGKYLCLELSNEAAYLKKRFAGRSWARGLQTQPGLPPFSIPLTLLDFNPAELYDIITTEVQMRRAQQTPSPLAHHLFGA